MPKESSIELNNRMFPAVMVRACCEAIYQAPIAEATWGNWREWSDVPRRRREFTFDQFCFIAAIATIRKNDRGTSKERRKLKQSEVMALAKSEDHQCTIAAAIEWADAMGKVVGKDAPAALAERGISVSLRQLYRKIPKFSASKVYKVDWLEKAIA